MFEFARKLTNELYSMAGVVLYSGAVALGATGAIGDGELKPAVAGAPQAYVQASAAAKKKTKYAITTSPLASVSEGSKYVCDIDTEGMPVDKIRKKTGLPTLSYKEAFFLEKAPEGMTINNDTGLITWPTYSGDVGTYPTTVVVRLDKRKHNKDGSIKKVKLGGKRQTLRKDFDVTVDKINGTYTLHVLDDSGTPKAGVPISLYPKGVYDPVTGTGDFSILQQKSQPDGYTDADGEARFNITAQTHFVVGNPPIESAALFSKASQTDSGTITQCLFNRFPNLIVGEQGAQSETVYNMSATGGNAGILCHFNAEGHILHQENPNQGGNKYCVGDIIPFYVFGDNSIGSTQTTSFAVLDLRANGNPNTAPVIYRGSFANPNEYLTVPNNTTKHKVFSWPVPVDLNGKEGKYAIYITWPGYDTNSDGTPEPWKNVGIFFLKRDTTPLDIQSVITSPRFTNEDADAWVVVTDTPEAGTVRASYSMEIQSGSGKEYWISSVNADPDGDGIPDTGLMVKSTDFPGKIPAPGEVVVPGDATQTGKNAVVKTFEIWAKDIAGNWSKSSSNPSSENSVEYHLIKAEADELANPIYDTFKIGAVDDPLNFFSDFNKLQSAATVPHWVLCNKHNDSYEVGHNYNRQGGLTEDQATDDNAVIAGNRGPPFAKPIARCTKTDFNGQLNSYMLDLKGKGKLPP